MTNEMDDAGVSRQFFLGWKELGCVISYSKPVINRRLWKAASANCLCAVSQVSLCSAAPAQFTSLETYCLCQLKPITLFRGTKEHLCSKMNECRKRKEWWKVGRRYGDFPNRRAPLCPRSCRHALLFELEGSYSLHKHTHTVTVRWVCPSCLVKHSHRASPPSPQEVFCVIINLVACGLHTEQSSWRPLRLEDASVKLFGGRTWSVTIAVFLLNIR